MMPGWRCAAEGAKCIGCGRLSLIHIYTLRVKLKSGADIEGVDLDSVTEATIDAKSPSFLLEELRKQFAELGLADNFNMKDNLLSLIHIFILGVFISNIYIENHKHDNAF